MSERKSFLRGLDVLTEGADAPVSESLRAEALDTAREARPWTRGKGIQGLGIAEKVTDGQALGSLALKVYVEMLAISSPYARRGALWNAFSKHFGRDGDPVLVWQADTRSMNPTVEESVIAKAYEEDPASASAEYSAQFRSDVERFVTLEVVQASTVPARQFLPPIEGIEYFGFVDPSGGSSDSMTLAVAHVESDKRVLDFVMERRPPFSPESVVEEFSAVLEKYGCFTVVGDRYAGEWPRERFREHGIVYDPSAKSKSDLYRELLPLLNSGRLELLDDERLAAQLLGLERRTSRGGRDAIDHAPGRHDDLINAAAGALLGAMEEGGASPRVWWIDDEPGGWVPAQKLIPWWH